VPTKRLNQRIISLKIFLVGQTYLEMAVTAIKALKDRTGSSSAAIKKYIVANNTVAFAQHNLKAALKAGVINGTLVLVKASYKLSEKVETHS
jgi:histone H1/5